MKGNLLLLLVGIFFVISNSKRLEQAVYNSWAESYKQYGDLVSNTKDTSIDMQNQTSVADYSYLDIPIDDPATHAHSSQQIVQHFMQPDLEEWHDSHTEQIEEPLDPATRPKKCYGIALADATDFGPYQAGALIGLISHQAKIGESYEVITGVALGALNAYILAINDYNNIQKATKELADFWLSLSRITSYNYWAGGFIYGYFFEKGLYDVSQLNEFLRSWFQGRDVVQHLTIAVTNILNGMFTTFDERHPTEELIKILQASVSFAGISPAVEAFNQLYFSGNAIYENDVMGAINHCQILGYPEEEIVIDTILGGNKELSVYKTTLQNSFSIMARAAELYQYYKIMRGLLRAKNGHTGVNFRYVIAPTFTMPSKIIPFQLTESETKTMLNHGERDANQAINNLINNPEAEIQERLASPSYIYYFNKERQSRYEKKLRDDLYEFIQGENKKALRAQRTN